jgi:hypothetical protein
MRLPATRSSASDLLRLHRPRVILDDDMDILKMLGDLRAEREQIEQAIMAIERLAAGTRGKRRGRPPAWMSKATEEVVETATFSTKRTMSAAARKRMADAQKKRWAAKKAEEKQSAS